MSVGVFLATVPADAEPYNYFNGYNGRIGDSSINKQGRFQREFEIKLPEDGEISGYIASISRDSTSIINFDGVYISSSDGLRLNFSPVSPERRDLVLQKLNAGSYKLKVSGRNKGVGEFRVTISFVPTSIPMGFAGWILTLLGFGFLGFVLRNRTSDRGRVRF